MEVNINMKLEDVRNKDLHGEGNKLYFRKILLTELIPHGTIEKHYHLKFYWREEKTPEFFNIYNARENARTMSLRRLPESPPEGLQSDLNE